MLSKMPRPSLTAAMMLAKLSSVRIMSEARSARRSWKNPIHPVRTTMLAIATASASLVEADRYRTGPTKQPDDGAIELLGEKEPRRRFRLALKLAWSVNDEPAKSLFVGETEPPRRKCDHGGRAYL